MTDMVRVDIYDGDLDIICGFAHQTMNWLKEKIDQVAPEFRNVIRISIEDECEYGETYSKLNLWYDRPLTDAELKEKADDHAARLRVSAAVQERRELVELARLKEKYES